MRRLILDAGAYIAAENNDPRIIALIKAADILRTPPVTPATVLAEVWRQHPHATIAKVLKGSYVSDLDEATAKSVGARRVGRASITDGHVVDVALRLAPAQIVTSDPNDIRALIPTGADITVTPI